MGTQADRDLALYTQWLGLAEFEVAEVVEDRALKQRRLVVVPSHRVGVCPLCHKACDQRHMHHDQCEVTDLPMASFATTLVVRVWQFYCDRCGKFFTPHYEAITAGVHVTERCLERMADMIRFEPDGVDIVINDIGALVLCFSGAPGAGPRGRRRRE